MNKAACNFIALDPATSTGYASDLGSGTWDLTPAKASPKKGRLAEPEYARPGKLEANLDQLVKDILGNPGWSRKVVVICEGAAAFSRGKAAVRVGHELRGVIKSWCWRNAFTYVEIQPGDLQEFVGGRRSVPKDEMLRIAQQRYKPECTSDDEADALHLLAWGKARYVV